MAVSCAECGALIPEGAQWCPSCGQGALAPCPRCGNLIPELAEMCPHCAVLFRLPSGAACDICGAPLLKRALFCVVCGEKAGARAVMRREDERCPHCGGELGERRRHCIHCGEKLA